MLTKRKHLQQGRKKIILLVGSVACITLFFLLPANRLWLQTRIIAPLHDFSKEYRNLDEAQRMQYRFGFVYKYSREIELSLKQKGKAKTALVLLPPTGYFKSHHIAYEVPEPVVFYYFTGIRTLWVTCSNAGEANWYVKAVNGQIIIDSVTNTQALRDSLAKFKKYKSL